MSEIANSEGASDEKPVHSDGVQFPPFPDPKDEDFDDDIPEEERIYYKTVFKDINMIKSMKLHCSACDRHLGCSARNEGRMRAHPMLRTLVCQNCHIFYNSGEFEKGDDGSELYCRWCGQGGQVYCCSDCPHVFCAKCIKRNLGSPKIKEIENADDWKCFKCNPKCLWDLRALCWAVLRFCDLKNKMAYQTQDLQLREAFKKDCAIDYSECCRNKSSKRNQKVETTKKKEIKKEADAKVTANLISKIPSTIQVKKFATINMEDAKPEKKAQKRPQSPKNKSSFVKTPISISPCTKLLNPISVPPVAKKMRLPNPSMMNAPMMNSPMMNSPMMNPPMMNPPMMNPIRIINPNDRKSMSTYARIRPKPPILPMPIANSSFNGFSTNIYSNISTDNINLSLESLTQGLDMSAVAALSHNSQDDDVVCTPDFPLEPLCEVTEDNDDDVQCITPAPVAAPKPVNPPPLVQRSTNNLTADVTSENIIQMTENDVTVNASTGGLKFRVDPQTLSSNKMYRLPDGRIFAINANPNMPGGYSATIVAVTEPTSKAAPKGATYAAKLSAVTTSSPSTPASKQTRNQPRILKRSTPKTARVTKSTETTSSTRECDLNVPVEWYRYNLIDAVDALDYALSRLNKLKKEATTVYLRTRSVNEMRNLHRTLERLLNTSASRFGEIRENLNKGLKQYISKKSIGDNISEDDDDDDVEILPDMDENDDPIFIDENSVESNMNGSENQEVDLTGAGSSEYNDSAEITKENNISKNDIDPLNVSENENEHSDLVPDININDSLMDTSLETIVNKNTDEEKNKEPDVKEDETENNAKENDTLNNIMENKADNIVTNDIKENTTDNLVTNEEKENNTDNITNEINENKNNNIVTNENDNSVKGKESNNVETSKENETDHDVKETTIASEVKENETDENDLKENEEDDVKENKTVTSVCDQLKSSDTPDEENAKVETDEKKSDKQSPHKEIEDCLPQTDLNDKADSQDSDDKMQDSEMSEEMIEKLLKDDNVGDELATNINSMDVPDVLQKT